MNSSSPRRLAHYAALDGIRAIAIIGVIGLHAIDRWFRGGFLGVDIFFVLSAFLISSLILGEVDVRGGRYDYRAFYWRRLFRLGPALALWLVFVAAPTSVLIGEAKAIPRSSLISLFYVGDFVLGLGASVGAAYAHIWSLAIEEQFYAVWPVLLVALAAIANVRAQRAILWVMLLASIGVAAATGHVLSGNYFLPTGHLVPIGAGCLAAHLFSRGMAARVEKAARRGGVAIVSILAYIGVFTMYRPVGVVAGLVIQCGVSLVTVVLILNVCLSASGIGRAVLTSVPAVWIGRRSYGLYLYHRTLAILIPALIPGGRLRVLGPVTVAVSLLVAEASFRWVERPVMTRGRRWLSHKYPQPGDEVAGRARHDASS